MNGTVARLAAFGLALALALGAGAVVGAAVGPEPPASAPSMSHDRHPTP